MIEAALDAVANQRGVGLTRMSGSGATVFGLSASGEDADRAAEILENEHGDWWVRRTVLGASAPADNL
jgi:4-diphosphocytidyl-2-C-methyl-D-erythritol kinase